MNYRGRWSNWSLIAVMALAAPLGAQALGLGEARVESYLNQPLDVRMRLLDASETDLDTLTVESASPEDFDRLGIMRSALVQDLEIEVDRSQNPPIIRITSSRPVTDPVVQLLVDARWANGRMLREYTLFLDPPTVEVEAPPPARSAPEAEQASRTQPTRPARSEPRRAAAQAPTEPEPAQQRPAAVSGDRRYGPVARGDTLWSIAWTHLPDDDVTMDQMMTAIVELNPDAFRNGNINRLLSGVELDLPSAEQALAIDQDEAAAMVAAQNRAFERLARSGTPTVSDAARDVAEAGGDDSAAGDDGAPDIGAEAADEADEADHRLSLVPPGDEQGGTGSGDDEAEIESLRQRLARAEEELYAARQEADEFRLRVEELESVVRENPGGLGIRDAELAGLEETLRDAREATREGADPELRAEVSQRLSEYLERYTAGPEDATAEEPGPLPEPDAEFASVSGPVDEDTVPDDGSDAGSDAETDADAAGDSEAVEAPADAAGADTEAQRESDDDSGAWWSSPIVLLVAGLVLLLLIAGGLGLAVRRRRQEVAEREQPLKRASDLPAQEKPSKAPVDDAWQAVNERPDDLGAHLALLRTLATEGREQEFGDALETMFDHVDSGDEPEWREALDLADRVVPGHPLVKGSSDWTSEPAGSEGGEEPSEIDDDTEVDDLMSRLDAESEGGDEAGDEDQWLGPQTRADDEEERGPLLSEPDTTGEDEEREEADTGAAEGEEAELWEEQPREETPADDEIASGIESESPDRESDEVDLEEAPSAEHDAESEVESVTSDREPEDEEADDLVLDWPDSGDEAAGESEVADRESEEEPRPEGGETAEADEDAEDIFSQSDDDTDVKLDLARAYLSWNSVDSARTLLKEVVEEGNESQRDEARKLLDDLPDESES